METTMKKPLIMVKARKQKKIEVNISGHYEDESDKWSEIDKYNATTYSRSSTTGAEFIGPFDPDEDKDD